jgi:uncharacterized sodium:solute symporter family permease YidK
LAIYQQAYQYIQEYTRFHQPGVVAIFLFGMFWKRTSANAALIAVVMAIPLSIMFKFVAPSLPFLDRMGMTFLILSALIILISFAENKAMMLMLLNWKKDYSGPPLHSISGAWDHWVAGSGVCAILVRKRRNILLKGPQS